MKYDIATRITSNLLILMMAREEQQAATHFYELHSSIAIRRQRSDSWEYLVPAGTLQEASSYILEVLPPGSTSISHSSSTYYMLYALPIIVLFYHE